MYVLTVNVIQINPFYFSAAKQVDSSANVKRENKLYSYKDQMAEIELRKELEKKKGKKKEEPKLSKKQQEQLAEQRKKEADIRTLCLQVRDLYFAHIKHISYDLTQVPFLPHLSIVIV